MSQQLMWCIIKRCPSAWPGWNVLVVTEESHQLASLCQPLACFTCSTFQSGDCDGGCRAYCRRRRVGPMRLSQSLLCHSVTVCLLGPCLARLYTTARICLTRLCATLQQPPQTCCHQWALRPACCGTRYPLSSPGCGHAGTGRTEVRQGEGVA